MNKHQKNPKFLTKLKIKSEIYQILSLKKYLMFVFSKYQTIIVSRLLFLYAYYFAFYDYLDKNWISWKVLWVCSGNNIFRIIYLL